jgi:hypothetical protein
MEMEVEKGRIVVRGEGIRVRRSQRFGSELKGARDRCAGLFPSLARDPALHLPGALNLPVPGHHHSLLIIVRGKVVCRYGCDVVAIHDVRDWDIRK